MPPFDPRQAALNHSADAKLAAYKKLGLTKEGYEASDFASSIACGLIYVGDQLARANLIAEYRLVGEVIMDATAASDELLERERALRYQLWPEREGQVGT